MGKNTKCKHYLKVIQLNDNVEVSMRDGLISGKDYF